MSYLVPVVQFFGSCVQHKWLLNGPVNEYQLINMYNLKNLCLDDQIIPEIIGAPFFSPCCIWCMTNILFFPIFYLIAILHFLIVIIMRELKMRIWIYLLHFFFNLLARNPLVWWIHVCGNLDILVFFFLYTYIAASLRWCAFPIKHSKFIWFKGVFSLFLIS